ncbi:hypothetical protein [Comamonas testosteroni]|uniref:hypothetical protein n=1 Tax=Comamonas testosteroni TaxID=285 RepID=UPI001E35D4BB|nr:hypothetical protein [Comamonas testosteroni]
MNSRVMNILRKAIGNSGLDFTYAFESSVVDSRVKHNAAQTELTKEAGVIAQCVINIWHVWQLAGF